MGWAARANRIVQEHPRQRKLRTFCKKATPDIICAAIRQMTRADADATCKMWNEVHPDQLVTPFDDEVTALNIRAFGQGES